MEELRMGRDYTAWMFRLSCLKINFDLWPSTRSRSSTFGTSASNGYKRETVTVLEIWFVTWYRLILNYHLLE